MRMKVVIKADGFILMGIDNPGVIKRAWNKAANRAAAVAALHWAQHIMLRHFQRSNWRTYRDGFKFKRKVSTQKIRARRWKHTAFLVNYPIGQPPADRRTLEGFLTRQIPDLSTKAGTATLTWDTPGVSTVYKEEATAHNDTDVEELAKVVNDQLFSDIASGRAPLTQRAKRSGVLGNRNVADRKSFRRFKQMVLVP